MIRISVILILVCSSAFALSKPKEEELRFLHDFKWGLIAQCRDSVMFELQVDSKPRKVEGKDLERLTSLLARAESYSELKPACRPSFDFKVVLVDDGDRHVGEAKICTSCGVLGISFDDVVVIRAAFTPAAEEELGCLLDDWFPGWRERSERNRKLHREELNKLSEPTATNGRGSS